MGQNVLIYGIHPSWESSSLVGDFVQQTGITYPVVPDNDTMWRFAYPPGANFPYPREVIIDKNLVIRSIESTFDVEEVQQVIDQLLSEP